MLAFIGSAGSAGSAGSGLGGGSFPRAEIRCQLLHNGGSWPAAGESRAAPMQQLAWISPHTGNDSATGATGATGEAHRG